MKRMSTLCIFFSLAFAITSIASPSYVFGSEAIATSSSLLDEVTFADQNINQDTESSSVSSSTISSSPEIVDNSTTTTSSFISDEVDDFSGAATSTDESLITEQNESSTSSSSENSVFLTTRQDAPQNQPPIITEITGPTNLMINASGTWVITAQDPEGKPLSYQVDWGNGTSTIQSSSTFTYAYPGDGTSTITFTVYDDQGLNAFRTSTVTVQVPTCGDVTKDGSVNSADVAYLINYLSIPGAPAPDKTLGDVNADSIISQLDVDYLITYLFQGGAAPLCSNPKSATCGDVVRDGVINQLDVDFLLAYLFKGGAAPADLTEADVNGDGKVNSADIGYLINYLNIGGPSPKCPIPPVSPPPSNGGGGGGGGGGSSNLPPIFLNFNPPTSTTSTFLYSYKVEAIDPEREIIIFVLRTAPPGMTIDSRSGLIEWTPKLEQATSTPYPVTVQISDGDNRVSTNYSILVNSPIIELAPLQPKIAATTTIIETPKSKGEFSEKLKKPLLIPSISIISTSTLTTATSSATTTAPAGGPSLLALLTPLLSMGLFDYLGSIASWVRSNYCILSFILWIVTLLTFLACVLRNRKEKREEVQEKIMVLPLSETENLAETVIPLNPPKIESV